jgi:hypothetical protein
MRKEVKSVRKGSQKEHKNRNFTNPLKREEEGSQA